MRVPHADTVLVGVPDGVDLDAAVFLGDTLATGYAAVQRAGLRPGDTSPSSAAARSGSSRASPRRRSARASSCSSSRWKPRRELAAARGRRSSPPRTAPARRDRVTDGRGADAVVDAIGGPAGWTTAFGLVRRRGSVVSVGMHTAADWALPVARAFADELTLRFVVGDLMRDAAALVGARAIRCDRPERWSYPRSYRLDDAPEAYRKMAERLRSSHCS